MSMDVVSNLRCDCGAEMAPASLACPICHRLVHAQRLSQLARDAEASEARKETSDALARWREMLELLPPQTSQYRAIEDKVNALSAQVTLSHAADSKAPNRRFSGASLAGVGAVALLLWKFKALLIFAVTKGKLLLMGLTNASTFLSMFVFFSVYWTAWGWPFALGIVLSIYVHEMGHVDALRRYGFKASAPMFLPGLGAVIRLKQRPANETEDARIGLAGPLWGTAAAALCWMIYLIGAGPFWAALAHFGALINIFNLLPIGSLDGGRGMRALSRGQAWMLSGALAGGWLLSEEGMLLLVALVALVRATMKPHDARPDRATFVLYLLIVAALTALVWGSRA